MKHLKRFIILLINFSVKFSIHNINIIKYVYSYVQYLKVARILKNSKNLKCSLMKILE